MSVNSNTNISPREIAYPISSTGVLLSLRGRVRTSDLQRDLRLETFVMLRTQLRYFGTSPSGRGAAPGLWRALMGPLGYLTQHCCHSNQNDTDSFIPISILRHICLFGLRCHGHRLLVFTTFMICEFMQRGSIFLCSPVPRQPVLSGSRCFSGETQAELGKHAAD